MLHRAYALPSTTDAFNEQWAKLRSIFSRIDYPIISLMNSTINMSIQNTATRPEKKTGDLNTIRIVLPFKDQSIAANAVRWQ